MKVELIQLAGRDGDTAYNLERTLEAIHTCAPDADLMVFPETQLMGFPTEQNISRLAEPLDGPTLTAVAQAAKAKGLGVVVGLAEAGDDGRFYNTTVLVTPEGIALKYRKTHLWSSDKGIFTPGDRYATALFKGVRIGLLICFDIEFPETARALGQLGVDLILVTNGNMDPYGPTHRTAISGRAMENQAYAVMVNRVGAGDGDLVFAGGSAVVDPYGQLLCEAGREPCRIQMDIDLSRVSAAQKDYSYLAERRFELPGQRVEHPCGLRELLIPAH
ncbi:MULTISPECIES: carbon-nitrogen hydrolase family protein [unclassified Pseudomonas]|uniref:carbon-nitrogen hydrolase family protein n=1 Tax=unclassified Pseudomonas TaxID=196821 RepID=UPI000BD4ADFE|nr:MULTISPECIES: carbon-nitrogen hydrolase family protein [unclassified Pseudomonas]PVZ12268.1 (R)-amidase [Pseudomonas sp. URIL14HWK12:I12]PVZ23580.1 (R)-amidase [Pseudomonas sp. URIL14HWK12:I10]PVZ32910.1 (R)-amidase [Pseudomonas sp. URIL14HWK12:I11]SNZ18778.1 (R)-amidase [Pseudomonas sp. URIL14HWK12:I9]